jgi:Concanavalin A-like lectin/glucanases superfamily
MKTHQLVTAAFILLVSASCEKTAGNTDETGNNSLPVVRYEFANNLNDQSGNSFTGNSDTAIDFVPDRFSRINQAIRFNGPTHNSYFKMPALGARQVRDTFSLSFWFTITATNNNNVFYKGDMAEGTESGQTILVSNGKLRIILGDGQQYTKEMDGTPTLNANTWYHLVLTVKTINDVSVYLNGVKYNQQMNIYGSPAGFAFKNNAAQVQGLLGGKAPFPLTDGKMDDFRLYNRAISAAEVAALYNYQP